MKQRENYFFMKKNKLFSINIIKAILLSSYPIAILYTSNYQNTTLLMYIIPLAIVYLVTFLLYIFIFYFFRTKHLANVYLYSSVFSIWLFIYGIVNEKLVSIDNSFLNIIGGNRFLLPISVILFVLLLLLLKQKKKEHIVFNNFLIIYLVFLNIYPIVYFIYKELIVIKNPLVVTVFDKQKIESKIDLPNVYYLVLDGYCSSNTLKKLFNFNNSNFNSELERIGFKINNEAHSNYSATIFSIASALNLDYIQNINNDNLYQIDLHNLISENSVSNLFKKNGYKYYLFDSGFGLKKKYANDEELIKTSSIILPSLFSTSDNDLYSTFINNSFLKVLNSSFFSRISLKNYSLKVLNVFQKLPLLSARKEKKFVFAHIISPHPPFLFDEFGVSSAYGNDIQGKLWDEKLYFSQLKFINHKVIEMVNQIIINDKGNKIIIIQGDHGSRIFPENGNFQKNQKWVEERFSIFNAIYTSNALSYGNKLKKEWNKSPVNSFRQVFNNIFNSNFQLLPDNIFYSNLQQPYIFSSIK